jgi:hypothetical protein
MRTLPNSFYFLNKLQYEYYTVNGDDLLGSYTV